MVSATLHNGTSQKALLEFSLKILIVKEYIQSLLHKGIIKNTFQSYDATLKNYFPKCKVFSLCLKNDEI